MSKLMMDGSISSWINKPSTLHTAILAFDFPHLQHAHIHIFFFNECDVHVCVNHVTSTSTYNLFRESNPSSESRLASANFSRSATLAEALLRLSLLPRDNGNHDDDDDDDFLLIDIVGVDHVECESKATIRNTFRPLVQWLGDYILATNQNQTQQNLT